jgi:hypothetical protein
MGLTSVLKISRLKTYFFLYLLKNHASRLSKIKNSPNRGVCKFTQNRYLRGIVCTKIQYDDDDDDGFILSLEEDTIA